MAALGKIRKHGVLLVTTIAVALFLFVAGDFVKGGQSLFQQNQQVVAQIDGKDINIQDYQKLVDELQNFYELTSGQSMSGEEQLNRMRDEAWQTLVQNTLIEKECDKLGLTVTDQEVAEIIQNGQSPMLNMPLFTNQQSGRYDYSLVQSLINEYNQLKSSGSQIPDAYQKAYKYYMFVQKQIRSQYLVQKYQTLLSKALISNPVEAQDNFNNRTNEASVLLATMPLSLIEDSKVEVTDSEIKDKFNADKAKYEQIIETRDIEYIDVAVTPSDADRKAAEEAMQEAYEQLAAATNNTAASNVCRQNTSQFVNSDILKKKEAYPQMIANMLDSVAVGETSQPQYDPMTNTFYTFRLLDKKTEADSVLYRTIGVAAETEAASLAKADSIVDAIKGGATFAEMAKKYNQPSDSAWMATADFQYATLDADNRLIVTTIYDMQPGTVKRVTISNGNNIVIEVLDRRNPIEKYNVAAIVKTLNFSDATYNNAYNKFSSFLAANNTADKIKENAEKEGYSLLTYPDVTTQQHIIAGIPATHDAMKWLFDEAKPGNVSPLYECGENNHLLVVILDQVNPAGYRPISKLQADLKVQIMNQKKVEQLMSQLEGVKSISEAQSKGAQIDTVNHITFDAPTFVKANVAYEPIISAVATQAQQGQVVGPIKGEGGAYMLQVLSKSQTADKFDAKAEQATISQAHLRIAMNQLINTLYMQTNVVDRRYKFF